MSIGIGNVYYDFVEMICNFVVYGFKKNEFEGFCFLGMMMGV